MIRRLNENRRLSGLPPAADYAFAWSLGSAAGAPRFGRVSSPSPTLGLARPPFAPAAPSGPVSRLFGSGMGARLLCLPPAWPCCFLRPLCGLSACWAPRWGLRPTRRSPAPFSGLLAPPGRWEWCPTASARTRRVVGLPLLRRGLGSPVRLPGALLCPSGHRSAGFVLDVAPVCA